MARGVKRAKEMSEGSQDDVPGPSNSKQMKRKKGETTEGKSRMKTSPQKTVKKTRKSERGATKVIFQEDDNEVIFEVAENNEFPSI